MDQITNFNHRIKKMFGNILSYVLEKNHVAKTFYMSTFSPIIFYGRFYYCLCQNTMR